jgi:PAS domain S-box-containing protein
MRPMTWSDPEDPTMYRRVPAIVLTVASHVRTAWEWLVNLECSITAVGMDGQRTSTRDGECARDDEAPVHAGQVISQTVLDATGCLVMMLDAGGRLVGWNRACEQLSGYSLTDVHAAPDMLSRLLPDEEPFRSARQLLANRLSRRIQLATHVNRWRTRRGDLRTITWSNAAIATDCAMAVIAIGIDITDIEDAKDQFAGRRRTFPAADRGRPRRDLSLPGSYRFGVWSTAVRRSCHTTGVDAPCALEIRFEPRS